MYTFQGMLARGSFSRFIYTLKEEILNEVRQEATAPAFRELKPMSGC